VRHVPRDEIPSGDREREIEYDSVRLSEIYPHSNLLPFHTDDVPEAVPYEVLFDFRTNPGVRVAWGGVHVKQVEYAFPEQLESHRTAMLDQHPVDASKPSGKKVCPRVSRFWISSTNTPNCEVQFASYIDQVGSNMYPDALLPTPIRCSSKEATTVRQWDMYANNLDDRLPTFERSKLANTIGVAVGIAAQRENGDEVIIWRRRGQTVHTYRGQPHVPFSFALNVRSPMDRVLGFTSIRDLIEWDFSAEQAEELAVEPEDFDDVQPLAWCRDLPRAGKPQLFLEMRCRLSYEELRSRIQKHSVGEFESNVEAMSVNDGPPPNASTELKAYIALKRRPLD
jgi:hypothetical protein